MLLMMLSKAWKPRSVSKYFREKKYACLASPHPEAPSESAEAPVLGPVEGSPEGLPEGLSTGHQRGQFQGPSQQASAVFLILLYHRPVLVALVCTSFLPVQYGQQDIGQGISGTEVGTVILLHLPGTVLS